MDVSKQSITFLTQTPLEYDTLHRFRLFYMRHPLLFQRR